MNTRWTAFVLLICGGACGGAGEIDPREAICAEASFESCPTEEGCLPVGGYRLDEEAYCLLDEMFRGCIVARPTVGLPDPPFCDELEP